MPVVRPVARACLRVPVLQEGERRRGILQGVRAGDGDDELPLAGERDQASSRPVAKR
jgi:hypothetical protein